MEFINTNRSENNASPFLLIWVLCIITFLIIVIVTGLFFLLFFLVFFMPFALFFLDIFLWHNIGKEIIYTQDKKLIIKKIKRVFPRKKKIRFEKIEDMYLWKERGFFKETFSDGLAFWDFDKQGSICIEYDNGCKYYIGRYLDETTAKKILEVLKSEIVCTHAEPSLKSKIMDRIVLIFIVFLLIFFGYIIISGVIGCVHHAMIMP